MANTTSNKVLQARRTLAQQNNFIKEFNQKRQTTTIQNLLSSSIQKAKEKVHSITHSQSYEHLNISNPQPKKNPQEGGVAVAAAMKALQSKISQLQRINQTNQKQKNLMNKQIQNLIHQKKVILNNLQETKRKYLSSEQIIRDQNIQIKQLQSKNLSSIAQIKNLNIELNSKNNIIEELKNSKEKIQKLYSEPKKTQSQMLFQTKLQQLKIKQQEMEQLEKKRIQQLKQSKANLAISLEINSKLQNKINELNKNINMNQAIISKLTSDLEYEKMKKSNLQCSTVQNNDNMRSLYTSRITQLQEELAIVKSKKNKKDNTTTKIQSLKEQLSQLKDKYEEIFLKLKRTQTKLQKQERQCKIYRSKFWQVKDVVSEIVDKLNRLPNGITSQLRYLIVKANKIQSAATLINENKLINITPSKNRNNSFERGSSKSSKSKSKKKSLKIDDLNSSKNSLKSNNSSKKKKNILNQQNKHKKSVIVSSNNIESENQILLLQKQIQNIKNQYKKLVKTIGDDQNQELRDQLNQLAFDLQQRSEELTILRRKNLNN